MPIVRPSSSTAFGTSSNSRRSPPRMHGEPRRLARAAADALDELEIVVDRLAFDRDDAVAERESRLLGREARRQLCRPRPAAAGTRTRSRGRRAACRARSARAARPRARAASAGAFRRLRRGPRPARRPSSTTPSRIASTAAWRVGVASPATAVISSSGTQVRARREGILRDLADHRLEARGCPASAGSSTRGSRTRGWRRDLRAARRCARAAAGG